MTSNRLLQRLAPEAGAVPAPALREAAGWLVRLREGATEQDRQAFERWRGASAAHELAFRRLESLMDGVTFGAAQAGGPFSARTLEQAARGERRRQTLRWMVAVAGGAAGAWMLADRDAVRVWTADARTSAGGSREVRLDDGTLMRLNTGTAVDWNYRPDRREVWLREGEIMVATAADPRPFMLHGRAATVLPLGTRFVARDLEGGRALRVAVMEGAVDLRGREAGARRVMAGEEAVMRRDGVCQVQPMRDASVVWLQGMLVADRQRLADFLADLGRYRPGFVQCAPEVADLRVVGAFPLADTDRVLAMLTEVLPVSVRYATPYWVRVGRA
jgi:transmembrane sensor